METPELVGKINTAGLYPIRVEGDTDPDGSSGLRFLGSLDEFLAAAKALEATVVFLFVSQLTDEDFQYASDNFENNSSDSEEGDFEESQESDEPIDLTIALPSLVEFKKNLGDDYAFLLTAKSPFGAINFFLAKDWWIAFDQERDKAIKKIDQDREAIYEKLEAKQRQKEDDLLKQLKGLLNDPEFSRVPTQRGMKAYALERFPDLEDVDDGRLTLEIQTLSDKVKARKRR